MKNSIYKSHIKAVKSFETQEKAIRYYQYMLDHNPESNVYPKELREFHKGLIMGLKASIELREGV